MESVDEIDAIKRRNAQQTAIQAAMGQTLARTYKETKDKREEAKARKLLFQRFAKNNNYRTFDSIRKLLEVYYEQKVTPMLTYTQYLKFIRVDDNGENRDIFYSALGVNQEAAEAQDPKHMKIDSKILMLYLVNSIPHAQYSKADKLNFAFNLFDEEDSRVITY